MNGNKGGISLTTGKYQNIPNSTFVRSIVTNENKTPIQNQSQIFNNNLKPKVNFFYNPLPNPGVHTANTPIYANNQQNHSQLINNHSSFNNIKLSESTVYENSSNSSEESVVVTRGNDAFPAYKAREDLKLLKTAKLTTSVVIDDDFASNASLKNSTVIAKGDDALLMLRIDALENYLKECNTEGYYKNNNIEKIIQDWELENNSKFHSSKSTGRAEMVLHRMKNKLSRQNSIEQEKSNEIQSNNDKIKIIEQYLELRDDVKKITKKWQKDSNVLIDKSISTEEMIKIVFNRLQKCPEKQKIEQYYSVVDQVKKINKELNQVHNKNLKEGAISSLNALKSNSLKSTRSTTSAKYDSELSDKDYYRNELNDIPKSSRHSESRVYDAGIEVIDNNIKKANKTCNNIDNMLEKIEGRIAELKKLHPTP